MSLFSRIARLVLRPRLPRIEGAIRVAGARGRITIGRDGFGIPSIDAGDARDAWFGLGLCHAQDRGGQLEIMLRVARGTLADVVGQDGLAIDRLSRRIGIHAAGEAQLEVADADIRSMLEAYAAGVNAGFGVTRRAHEHVLLGIRPTPWTGADAQSIATLLCFALASNWDVELVRWELARAHGPDALVALDPAAGGAGGADAGDRAHDVQASIEALRAEVSALGEILGLGGGSNAWALAADRTATGRPILCGDPHLPPQAPNPFYLARIECPEFLAIGATFPGIPALAAGHNGHIAWGITAAHLDTTDWFVEELGPDGRSVRRGDRFVPCAVRREEIRVKGRPEPVVEDVLVTSHGPIVGPALDRAGSPARDVAGLALAATWLAARPYRGLLGAHLARDVASLRACFSQASATNVGVVFAAAPTAEAPRGHIGVVFAAEVPVRRRGTGPLPQPGWDERFGWDGLVPWDALPFVVDPPAGFVAAANAPPPVGAAGPGAADGQAPFLGVDFLDDFRLRTIERALAGRAEWDVAACQRLQIDTRALPWESLRAPVLAALEGGPIHERLASWDGQVAASSVGATVYTHLVAALCRRVVLAKAGGGAADAALGRGATSFLPYNLLFARRISHLVRLVVEQPDGWFPGGWPQMIREAALEALREIERRAGPDPIDWAWGRVRPLRLKHPFGDKPLLGRLFDLGPYPIGGDTTTIPQAPVDLREPAKNPIGIASLRMVIDVGDWDRSTFILAGGQSGNPFSPHAADQVARWLEADGVPIHATRAERARVVTHTLVVEPGS